MEDSYIIKPESFLGLDWDLLFEEKGAVTLVCCEDGLEQFETEKLKDLEVKPGSNIKFNAKEKFFIMGRLEISRYARENNVKPSTINESISWYNEKITEGIVPQSLQAPNSIKKFTIARYFMLPAHIHTHFRDFDNSDCEKVSRFERFKATEILKFYKKTNGLGSGKWLLRRSSISRSEEKMKEVTKFGVKFYALSFMRPEHQEPQHSLFKYRPGEGWLAITITDKVLFWKIHFLDFLLEMLKRLNLEYGGVISKYVEA